MESFDYVILGAGLGGLSAAACLTRQGYRVAVLEKHYLPGGCCHTFDYGDYRFCADVHYISQCGTGQTIERFLSYIDREVPFNTLDPNCIDRVITPAIDFKIPLGWENLRDRLLTTFPAEAPAINRYCDEISHLHQDMHNVVREMHWFDRKWSDWLKMPKYWNLFLKQHWTLQLTHMLAQNTAQTPAEDRSQSYLQLIQTLLGCAKGDEAAILNQHPELMDEGLVYTMKQVAAQLDAQGSQDIAIYLKHLAAEIHHGWLQPNERHGRSSISSPPERASIDPELATVSSLRSPNGHSDAPIDPGVATASKLHPDEGRFVAANPNPRLSPPLHSQIDTPIDSGVATVKNRHPNEATTEIATPMPSSAPTSNNQIEELLVNISSQLEQMEISIGKHSTPSNPLWYMPILEQADTQGWIISSEEVEQLIGIKPHCDSGHNFFMRGCWKFVKVGKIGTHSSWRVIKEIVTLPSVGVDVTSAVHPAGLTPTAEVSTRENRTPESEPQETNLEPELASPWTESN